MCAIFGWIDFKGIVNSKLLNKLTQALADASEERGTDAAGIAYVQDGRVSIYKRPKPAHKLRFKVPHGTHAVMGHTRFATQGDQKLNYNNHPFFGKADRCFALAHNGVIYNDKELRDKFNLPFTQIETDSYIAVQLIEHFGKLDLDVLRGVAEELRGTFNLTILDDKNAMYFVKGSNPLTILHFEALGLYIYASTDTILDKALSRTVFQNFGKEKIKLTEGEILRVDKNGTTMSSAYKPSNNIRYQWYDWDDLEDYYYNNYYKSHFSELYDFAKMNGVDDEIIDELLDFGFMDTEIEEMITDTELLDNTLCYVRGYDTDDTAGKSTGYSDYRFIDC